MKIYAKQVPPEYQESPFEHWDDVNAEIYGNKHFRGITSELFDRLPVMLDELAAVWDNMRNGYGSGLTWAEELADVVPPQGRPEYTREERRDAWPYIMKNFVCYSQNNEFYCRALELITGRRWDWCTLRGCCQGDWQYCIYPADEWNGESLERLEAEYFNTGTEWIIHDDETPPESPEDVSGFSVYCTAWSDEELKKEIADAAGGSPADVTLYKFTGFSRRAEYEEA